MPYRILIAEDNDVSRKMMAEVLKKQDYVVVEARDGEEACQLVHEHQFDLALIDVHMDHKDGFEFIEYLVVQGIKLPVVIISGDESSDLLLRANSLGVEQVLQKPILPERLTYTVQRALERQQLLAASEVGMGSTVKTGFSDDKDLVLRSIEIAVGNAVSGNGRAFGAVVANKDGHILGEGANGFASRADPTAHAEVMAIRQAAERLNRSDLSDCILYCSCEPTMIGKALILSVGIQQVFYSLSHKDIADLDRIERRIKENIIADTPPDVVYQQICHEEGRKVFSMDAPV